MRASAVEHVVSVGRWYVRYAPGAPGVAALSARWLNPRLRNHHRCVVTRSRVGVRFAVDTRDLIQRYVYMFGVWEPHMTCWLRGRLQPGDTFVDVGANVGYFAFLAARLVGDQGRVVAIEASPVYHRALLRQAQLNGFTAVRAVNTAISDKREELTFALASARNLGANSVVPYDGPTASTFAIEARPLPEVLLPSEIGAARVIKVDVEGAEGKVVRGMEPMFDRLRDDVEITVEVAPERMAKLGDSSEKLLDIMAKHGFHAYRLANEYTPESYVAALSGPAKVPVRLRGPVAGESDLIFSRVDAEALP
ncbi:FkbM family methyltransferase [Streptomyces sp. UNOB3_S3]|uniref:FkbM family methyltransferase n=1 Tax=Streptomyces sp. UNOB3_S3 TaxID=2871682 RepID=UPI001E4791D7|nr:FkbM family methyltransferase [Streptomyces sp. UNOB3_S3]MCC3774086.1 FkbM family methyltransferase [Streptomyces sp. UNOB3_S3]